MLFSGRLGRVRFTVGLDDFKGLFRLKWFYRSLARKWPNAAVAEEKKTPGYHFRNMVGYAQLCSTAALTSLGCLAPEGRSDLLVIWSHQTPALSFVSGIMLTLNFGRTSSEDSCVGFVSVPVGLSRWLIIGHWVFSAIAKAMWRKILQDTRALTPVFLC